MPSEKLRLALKDFHERRKVGFTSQLSRALETGDRDFLCRWFSMRGIEPAELAADIIIEVLENGDFSFSGYDNSDCSIGGWIKCRLIEAEHPHYSPGYQLPEVDSLKVKMHCFFIHIEETPEQLACLKNGGDPVLRQAIARSRIRKYLSNINPIDRVAQRVAPKPKWYVDENTQPEDRARY